LPHCLRTFENDKSVVQEWKRMRMQRRLIIVIAWIVCVCLTLWGAFRYPLNTLEPVYVVMYETVVIGWMSLLMLLVYKKGLPSQSEK